jgi:hypothetical protein
MLIIPPGLPYHPQAPAPCWGTTISKDDGWKVVVKCGNGHVGSLANHEIKPDGRVHPSLDCPEPGCDWHVTARLDQWAQRA